MIQTQPQTVHVQLVINTINNVNRTEWSLIRSEIMRVINKIGRPRSGSPICLITSIYDCRSIGRNEVLLPIINRNYNKICDILGFFKVKTQEILRGFFFASTEN